MSIIKIERFGDSRSWGYIVSHGKTRDFKERYRNNVVIIDGHYLLQELSGDGNGNNWYIYDEEMREAARSIIGKDY